MRGPHAPHVAGGSYVPTGGHHPPLDPLCCLPLGRGETLSPQAADRPGPKRLSWKG